MWVIFFSIGAIGWAFPWIFFPWWPRSLKPWDRIGRGIAGCWLFAGAINFIEWVRSVTMQQ